MHSAAYSLIRTDAALQRHPLENFDTLPVSQFSRGAAQLATPLDSIQMTITFDSRQLCLIPTVWRQDLVSADPQCLPEETRWLSFRAKAGWPADWFDDRLLFDVPFEIGVRSESASKWREERSAEFEGTVGILTYYEGTQDSETEQKAKPFVSGGFSVTDSVFEDIWERVKFRTAMPCDIWLEVLGLEIDPLPSGEDYWDVKKQSKLKIVSVKLRFSTEQPSSVLPNSTVETDAP